VASKSEKSSKFSQQDLEEDEEGDEEKSPKTGGRKRRSSMDFICREMRWLLQAVREVKDLIVRDSWRRFEGSDLFPSFQQAFDEQRTYDSTIRGVEEDGFSESIPPSSADMINPNSSIKVQIKGKTRSRSSSNDEKKRTRSRSSSGEKSEKVTSESVSKSVTIHENEENEEGDDALANLGESEYESNI